MFLRFRKDIFKEIKKWRLPVFIAFMFLIWGCLYKGSRHTPDVIDTVAENHNIQKSANAVSPSLNITFHPLALSDSVAIIFSGLFKREEINLILALNRLDITELWRVDTLVIPDTFLADLRLYSPFPDTLPKLKQVHKILFISHYAQAFAAYENGNQIRWGPVSLGKQSTPTPVGLFFTNWKSKQRVSTIDEEWILKWYFNIENFDGISLHEYDLPGFPASHSCVRLNEADAKWFYHWCDQWKLQQDSIAAYGTPVIIFGTYPFGKPKPWQALPVNNKAVTISREELQELIGDYLPIIHQRQGQHDSLPEYSVL